MQKELVVSARKTRTWMAVLALAWLAACAKSTPPSGGVDGESHFLRSCKQSCADGLECIGEVCTASCTGDDPCRELNADATCERVSGTSQCELGCSDADDCNGLGASFVCMDAACRERADNDGDDGKRAAGEPCTESSQCASNICQGMGCGDDSPGTCVGGTMTRTCSGDVVTYCGCDGESFVAASGSCPNKRYAKRGPCDECRGQGRYQAGKGNEYVPCCDGLTEVLWQQPGTTANGETMCFEPVGHREYGCVSGTCGDGRCEPGEDGACGCETDCDGGSGADAGNADGEPCESGSDCRSGVCEGLGCDADQLGTCTPRERFCRLDLVQYCGCDGVTFGSGSNCPGRRYAHAGGC